MSVRARRALERHGGIAAAFAVLLGLGLYWASIPADWGSFEVQALAVDALPLAFAAMAQAVVVVSGGIDLSVGATMSLANVVSAKYMVELSTRDAILLALAIAAATALGGALTGAIVAVTRVPDAVVTFATSFIWAGVALLVLADAGGGAPSGYRELGVGTVLSEWAPTALVVIAGVVMVAWLPLRLTKPGLAIYAVGRSRDDARLSGVSVARARIGAYAFAGGFAGLGGLALTATTGIGDPLSGGPYTLDSIAAVVLGGVSLLGGVGGVIGPIAAAFALTLVSSILALEHVDRDWARLIRDAVVVAVVATGALVAGQQRIKVWVSTRSWGVMPRLRRTDRVSRLADRPTVTLVVVLMSLVAVTELLNREQTGSAFWTSSQVSTTVLYAAILALLAAGQTLVVLTGGIDLSVATTATAAAFMVAGFATDGTSLSIAVALLVGLGIGIANGIGVGLFRVNPLVMTLGISTLTLGGLAIFSRHRPLGDVPELVTTLGSGRFLTDVPYDVLVWAPIAVLVVLGLRDSGLGRGISTVGESRGTSLLAEVYTWRVEVIVYALCGVLAALAGILLAGFGDAVDLGIASPLLLPSIAAVFIGGTSIFGGGGGYTGTIVGALALTVLDSLLTIVDTSRGAREIVYAAIILALVSIDAHRASRT